MTHANIIRGLSYLALLLYVCTSTAFLGGMIILIKTGSAPEGVWWSEYPAMTLAFATVLAQSLIGERVLNAKMHKVLRVILGVEWVAVFVIFCVTLPIYMLASQPPGRSLAETVEWIKSEGSVTYWILFSIVASMEAGVVGILSAAGHDKNLDALAEQHKVQTIAGGVGRNQRNVLRVLTEASSHIHQTIEVIIVSTDPPLNESQIRVALKSLLESGQVKDAGGKPKVYELGEFNV